MDAIKAEKEIAMRRFRRLRQIGHLLRCIEAAAALILLSYSSTHIPSAARNSGQFLRRASSFLISPRFVFLLGNAIVLLLLKSGHFSSESAAAATGFGNICGEISCPPQILGTAAKEGRRACRRSRSERLGRRREEGKLRRAETEGFGGGGEAAHDRGEVAAQDRAGAEEEVDAEEFRRTIEEFIAKQQRFRREESLAVVGCSDGPEDAVVL